MNDEHTWWDKDVKWLNNECERVGLGDQSDDTCDLFAEMVVEKWKEVKDIELARIVVFSDLMGIK